jgi:hypothetical protein
MQLFASSLGAESTGVLLIYLNAAPVQYAVGNAVLIILGPVIVALTYAGRGRGRCVRLMQISLLGCVAPIRAEHHRRLHQNREDRQAVMCSTSDSATHLLTRAALSKNWRESEFEIVNTTFLSDLDY